MLNTCSIRNFSLLNLSCYLAVMRPSLANIDSKRLSHMRITINLLPKKSWNNFFFAPELNSCDLRIFHLLLTSVNQFDSKPLPYCLYLYSIHELHPTNKHIRLLFLPIPFLLSLSFSMTCLWLFYFPSSDIG